MSEYLKICEQAARAGGDVLLAWRGRFRVREKAPADLVTEADLASQRRIREVVLGAFPKHGFLGEEHALEAENDVGESPFRWIVDPLDGTTNYVHQVPMYCVSVALERAGELLAATVFDPVSGECFTAAAGEGAWLDGQPIRTSDVDRLDEALVAVSFGVTVSDDEIARFLRVLPVSQAVRRFGSCALNLAYVAAGRLDAYWATSAHSWDVAAGVLLIQEAGGVVTDLDGQPFNLRRPVFAAAANALLHRRFLDTLANAG